MTRGAVRQLQEYTSCENVKKTTCSQAMLTSFFKHTGQLRAVTFKRFRKVSVMKLFNPEFSEGNGVQWIEKWSIKINEQIS